MPTGREGVSPAGPGPADYPAHRPILDALRHYFRPELLGRIGRIVVFSPLSEADLRPILDKILDRVHARLATRAITLTLTPAGRALLLRHGTDRRAGPLPRAGRRPPPRPAPGPRPPHRRHSRRLDGPGRCRG
ncbi:hypothetical protein ACFWBC_05470 [Streptomyces sp. NPDC059985]|uniref:hypothetical protein n=1 Tax=Streptomyces sp. NPDC059985 TaxID=3347025 RepID=UPI0036A98791